jgi:hypothetical protein
MSKIFFCTKTTHLTDYSNNIMLLSGIQTLVENYYAEIKINWRTTKKLKKYIYFGTEWWLSF